MKYLPFENLNFLENFNHNKKTNFYERFDLLVFNDSKVFRFYFQSSMNEIDQRN